jgi:endoribonuclease LACTB2
MNNHSCCIIFLIKNMKREEAYFVLINKKFTQETISGVQMGNATVAFGGVKLHVYCFVLDGTLIDTGSKSVEKELIPFFQQQEIDQVVITHYHEDHTGCASYFQEVKNVPIYMSEIMLEYCKKKADYPLYRKVFWGKRKPFHAQPIGKTFSSRNATWDVIETPGHAIDHLAFLNRETGQLFTGDLYVMGKTKVILREESIPAIIESLKKVLTYDFKEVFCSHAGFLKKGRAALERKLEYLLELQDRVLQLYNDGMSVNEITKTLFPKKYPIITISSGEWDSKHIIRSIIEGDKKNVVSAKIR